MLIIALTEKKLKTRLQVKPEVHAGQRLSRLAQQGFVDRRCAVHDVLEGADVEVLEPLVVHHHLDHGGYQQGVLDAVVLHQLQEAARIKGGHDTERIAQGQGGV